MASQSAGSYVVVSPVKDEEQYVEATIQAMLKQTIRPKAWIIVDDGSSDRTCEILAPYAADCDWIRVLRIRRDAMRRLGSAEIRAFQAGYEQVKTLDFDFIVKLDGDLDLPHNYFERLLTAFKQDAKLGIASGVYLEKRDDKWNPTKMPSYHVSGASKIVRRQCFDDIGGFPLFPGWDTADEIKAQSKGWSTRHFTDIPFYHLRPEGSGIGFVKAGILHGEAYYVCNGGTVFFALKVLHRLFFGSPFILAGLMLAYGYVRARIQGLNHLINKSESEFYRRQLNERLSSRLKTLLHLSKNSQRLSGDLQ